MAAPSFWVDWDTNGTNQVVVTSGHTTDGYAVNEVPTSSEMNKWMAGVGLWVRFFDSQITTQTILIPASAGYGFSHSLSSSGNTDDTDNPSRSYLVAHDGTNGTYGQIAANTSSTDTSGWIFPVVIPAGRKVTAVRVRCKDTASFPLAAALYSTTSAGDVQVGATQTSNGTGVQTVTIGSLSFTTASLSYLTLIVSAGYLGTGGAPTLLVWGAEVDHQAA